MPGKVLPAEPPWPSANFSGFRGLFEGQETDASVKRKACSISRSADGWNNINHLRLQKCSKDAVSRSASCARARLLRAYGSKTRSWDVENLHHRWWRSWLWTSKLTQNYLDDQLDFTGHPGKIKELFSQTNTNTNLGVLEESWKETIILFKFPTWFQQKLKGSRMLQIATSTSNTSDLQQKMSHFGPSRASIC